jgi:hypothetical protein
MINLIEVLRYTIDLSNSQIMTKSAKASVAPVEIISKIYVLREQKVMLDFDLADLYKVETKRLKEAVRRNKKDFHPILCFN